MKPKSALTPWIIVAGDFNNSGGMDKANRVLAQALLDRGTPVHLVAHSVDAELAAHPLAVVHKIPRPLSSYFLAGPLLDFAGRRLWRKLQRTWPDTVIVSNGGNCLAAGINWSHFVQRAWHPDLSHAGWAYRLRHLIERNWELRREAIAYRRARLIITNSDMTSEDVRKCMPGGHEKIHRVYLGAEPCWLPVTEAERAEQRRAFLVPAHKRIALFAGALSRDNRKGLDVLLKAWKSLCEHTAWDVELWVAGTGPSLSQLQGFVDANGLSGRVRFLGFRRDIFQLLACADLLVSAPRYEPYGLNVQEALLRGVSVFTSTRSGVAERFKGELRALLCEDPDNPEEIAAKLLTWRSRPDHWRELCASLGNSLRKQTWSAMAEEILELIEHGRPVHDVALTAAD